MGRNRFFWFGVRARAKTTPIDSASQTVITKVISQRIQRSSSKSRFFRHGRNPASAQSCTARFSRGDQRGQKAKSKKQKAKAKSKKQGPGPSRGRKERKKEFSYPSEQNPLISRTHARTHARTKRNDFPVAWHELRSHSPSDRHLPILSKFFHF